MALGKTDLDTLAKMQALCTQVEADNAQIKPFIRALAAADKRRIELQALYEQDWLRLSQPGRLSPSQRAALDALPDRGRYSILDQDTLWNTLSDQHALRLRLLKALVKSL